MRFAGSIGWFVASRRRPLEEVGRSTGIRDHAVLSTEDASVRGADEPVFGPRDVQFDAGRSVAIVLRALHTVRTAAIDSVFTSTVTSERGHRDDEAEEHCCRQQDLNGRRGEHAEGRVERRPGAPIDAAAAGVLEEKHGPEEAE